MVFLVSGKIYYEALFGQRWKDRLLFLGRHELVTIVGQLEWISGDTIRLENCELQPVKADMPPSAA